MEQDCTASWGANELDGTATATGTADCGLPGATVSTTRNASGTIISMTSSGTQYSAVSSPGASFSIPAQSVGAYQPTASFTISSGTSGAGNGGASVNYRVQAFPVTISLTGTLTNSSGQPLLDSSGNQQILIGQGCSARLSGIPSGCTVSNYSWTVSGSTFQSWSVVADPNNQSHTAEADGYGTATNSGLSWYWNDLKQTTETVTCTATVTPPAGQGAAFPITVTQKVPVYVPGWTCMGTAGTMQVNTALGGANGNYFLYAGPTDTSTPGRGMEWKAKLTPQGAPFSGTGALELVQTDTPNLTYTLSTGVAYKRSNNGQQGLDTSYDYGWDSPSTAPIYTAGDSPNISLTGVASAQLNHSFVDTLMYEPPGSGQYVPLATFTWSTNGSAQIPASKNWKDYGSGSAGTLTPTGATPISFTPSIAFPSWPQNVGVGWTWVAAKQ